MSKLNWMTKACGVFLLWATAAAALPAQTYTTLFSFNGTNGNDPSGALVQATNGSLYGTTEQGGANGDGTVFKITPSGTLTTVWNFCSEYSCADGAGPNAGVIQATNGDFYGTTLDGGGYSYGTIFQITPSGALTQLLDFTGTGPEGYNPAAALVQGTDGNLYGTALGGGDNAAGAVFQITTSGTLTTSIGFDWVNGATPEAALVQGTDGYFYGTAYQGGTKGPCILANGCGTVFRTTTDGALSALYSFCSQPNCTDGSSPYAALVQGTDGNFYGTTTGGGISSFCPYDPDPEGCGTVFKITPTGTLTTLYNFCSQGGSNCTDGVGPNVALVEGSDGNFYGTTQGGGANTSCYDGYGCGTIFKITPSGTLTTLYNFCSQSGCTDGVDPDAPLVQDTNGTFYGTTVLGGTSDDCTSYYVDGCGTVFTLSAGLRPFVKTQPTFGAVGAVVTILGTNLTGATSVTFNGTAATFTVISGSEINTTVPTGATTGKVQVTVSSRTLSSNVPFIVRP
jgi:uncharacterized repeat protein (TIGR03803 family)